MTPTLWTRIELLVHVLSVWHRTDDGTFKDSTLILSNPPRLHYSHPTYFSGSLLSRWSRMWCSLWFSLRVFDFPDLLWCDIVKYEKNGSVCLDDVILVNTRVSRCELSVPPVIFRLSFSAQAKPILLCLTMTGSRVTCVRDFFQSSALPL